MSDFIKFTSIYNEFKGNIFNYFLFRTNFDKELSEDLTEDVFEKVIDKIDSIQNENNIKVWIYKVAHNHLVDYFRKSKELLIIDDIDENIDSKVHVDDKDFLNNLIDTKTSIESLKEAIKQLNKTDQYLIALKFFDDLEYEEMEQVLKKNKIAIRTGVSRALKNLKDIINQKT